MDKIKIVAIIGKSASGKDSIAKEVLRREGASAHQIISHTSRPPRDCEIDGRDYHFVTAEDFAKAIEEDKMLEVSFFNDWWYGTSIEELSSTAINVGVFNPEGIETLLSDERIELDIYYILASDKTRMLRQLTREENPNIAEICRRYGTDETDFAAHKLDFNYISIENETTEDFYDAVETIRNISFM